MDKSSIIIEIGGRYTKVGYSPESSPRFIIPTNLTPLDISLWLSSGTSIDKINNPDNKIQKIPTSIELKESIYIFLKSLFLKYLLCKADERKIIIVENLFLPRLFRECLVSVLFEQFKVPMIVFINPTASMIPTLRTTSLLIDVGYGETRVLPIYEGIGILKSFETIKLGSETLIRELKQLLSSSSSSSSNQIKLINNENSIEIDDKEIVNKEIENIINNNLILEDIITRCCICSYNVSTNNNNNNNNNENENEIKDIKYRISKSYSILINKNIRLNLINRLYRNELNQEQLEINQQQYESFEEGNIATTILESLLKCEHDQRKPLSHNILLLGGTTMIKGFKRRLIVELNKQIKESHQFNKELQGLIGHFDFINHPFKSNYLMWLGGSILANTIEHIYSKISLDQYINCPTLSKRNQLIPEWENLSNINNLSQIAQSTIGTTINPLQFSSQTSLFSPFTSSNDLSSYLNKD